MHVKIQEEYFTLCPEKCVIRHSDNSLIIADAHIGKSNHFRKAGIGVPNQLIFSEVNKINEVVAKYDPYTIIFLGDLFHSVYNQSVEIIKALIDHHSDKQFILVKGNHDVMPDIALTKTGLQIVEDIRDSALLFTHEARNGDTGLFNIYGHIHPGIVLTSRGKQSLRLPCFLISPQFACLPAFGVFTGLAMVKPEKEDEVYVVAEGQVIRVFGP